MEEFKLDDDLRILNCNHGESAVQYKAVACFEKRETSVIGSNKWFLQVFTWTVLMSG